MRLGNLLHSLICAQTDLLIDCSCLVGSPSKAAVLPMHQLACRNSFDSAHRPEEMVWLAAQLVMEAVVYLQVSEIDLSYNAFTGTLPASWSNISGVSTRCFCIQYNSYNILRIWGVKKRRLHGYNRYCHT